MLVLGLAVYARIDLGIYAELPAAVRALIGIPAHAAPAVLAYSEMLASVGALAFVGVAIALGAHAVAGEEQDRTLSLILAAPVSRAGYVLARATAILVLVCAGGVLLWGAAALFHAALALAIGAATGRKTVAAGAAVAVMVLGWLGSSLLPLWHAGAADWIPWHWCNGSSPLVNGVDVGQIALSVGGAIALTGAGVLGFRTRELRLSVATGVLTRLQALPGIRLLLSVAGSFAATFPAAIAALFGGGDLATPAGFLHLEIFGLLAPAAAILVGVVAASAGLAGEEQHRRMSLLLAQPFSRARAYWTVGAAAAVNVALVGVALGLGCWVGIAVSGVGISSAHLVIACALLLLLGWWFAALALLSAAATGRTARATWIPTGFALLSYFGSTLLSAAGEDRWGWWQPLWLAVGTAILALLGQPLFARRDIRIGA